MAATLGTLPVKILAQVGDGEPIEIGTYDIPISIGEQKPAVYRDIKVNAKTEFLPNGKPIILDTERFRENVNRQVQAGVASY